MTTEHPITPSTEWIAFCWKEYITNRSTFGELITKVARWGADQELDQCVEWLISNQNPRWGAALQEGRRPKPPSLKEQALAKLEAMERLWEASGNTPSDLVRRALESLPD